MKRRALQFACFALALSGCDTKDSGEATASPKTADASTKTPKPEPDPVPPPKPEPKPKPKLAVVSVASVQIMQDCPDPVTAPPPAAKPAAAPTEVAGDMPPAAPMPPRAGAAARRSTHSGRSMRQPCTQSTMQLAFTGQGPAPATVRIKEIALFPAAGGAASGGELGTLRSRGPAAFVDGSYKPWDETLKPGGDLKASYKLSMPNWSEVESRNGSKTSFGAMFVLEIDVEIDGVVQTVRSPEFTRERPHVMVT